MSGRQGASIFGKLRNDKKEVEYQRLGAQIQNVKKSNVYVFGDDIYEDEDVVEYEMENIRSRKRQRNSELPKESGSLFVVRKIAEGDTLQSLSLQYGCPISELKRINNLIRDQEFYALTSVKIPVKKHSFLIEQIHKEETFDNVSDSTDNMTETKALNGAAYLSADENTVIDNTDSESIHDMSDPETQKLLIRTLSIGKTTRSQNKEAEEFLASMDKDLSRIQSSTRTDRESLDEVISVLTNKSVYPLISPRKSHLDGTDCGISWKSIIMVAVLVGLVIPLLGYLGYLAYHHYNSSNSSKTGS